MHCECQILNKILFCVYSLIVEWILGFCNTCKMLLVLPGITSLLAVCAERKWKYNNGGGGWEENERGHPLENSGIGSMAGPGVGRRGAASQKYW